MSTSNPAFAFPRNTPLSTASGYPTREHAKVLELLLYEASKIKQHAIDYTPLNPATATTGQIATALNALMTAIKET